MSQRFVSTDRQGGSGDGYYVAECDNCEGIIEIYDNYKIRPNMDLCIKCKDSVRLRWEIELFTALPPKVN